MLNDVGERMPPCGTPVLNYFLNYYFYIIIYSMRIFGITVCMIVSPI